MIRNIILILIFVFKLMFLFSQTVETNSYDVFNHLEKNIKSNGSTITYQYDEAGNRIGMIVTSNQSTGFSNNISQLDVKLYPNPTSESFCISGFEDNAALRLTDISGKVILAKQVSDNEIISISSLSKGIYIVELITKKGVIEKKLLKK